MGGRGACEGKGGSRGPGRTIGGGSIRRSFTSRVRRRCPERQRRRWGGRQSIRVVGGGNWDLGGILTCMGESGKYLS